MYIRKLSFLYLYIKINLSFCQINLLKIVDLPILYGITYVIYINYQYFIFRFKVIGVYAYYHVIYLQIYAAGF